MNRFPRLAVVLLVVGVVAGLAAIAASPGQAPQQPAAPAPHRDAAQGTHVVRVYYFHTTQRCASCKKIEALSAEAVRTGFERELSDGRLEWQVVNIDSTIIAEAPRMAPHIPRMLENIAADLGLPPGAVSVKAKTSEKLGSIGRGEGIAAQAVALITRTDRKAAGSSD